MNTRILKILTLLLLLFYYKDLYAQDESDIETPVNNSFQLDGDISGSIQNSVNESTGKVLFSEMLGSVSSGPLSYSVNIAYNNQAGFKTGREVNKYSPTSIVGVGWSLSVPKIVVDNKQTKTREDDVFYFQSGASNSKLICVDKNYGVWTFQSENHSNWQIKYYKSISIFEQDPITGTWSIVEKETDFWEVVTDDGTYQYYGYTSYNYFSLPNTDSNTKSKEFVSTWGNWIGDSTRTPDDQSTIVWNLSEIRDQWENSIKFKYSLIEGKQNNSQIFNKHTEASYLNEVISSKGSKIVLSYTDKQSDEYYEPEPIPVEPDAYQERYEKKYLSKVEQYNNYNDIIISYDLGYNLYQSSTSNKKRYLTSITQNSHSNSQIYSLPPKAFEYFTAGTFKGGLKKTNYPTGGSVTYNYQNKFIFSNTSNIFEIPQEFLSDYTFNSVVVKDNYSLYVTRTKNQVSGNKYRVKFYRYWWTGNEWKSSVFTFPHLLEFISSTNQFKDLYSIQGDDFYGLLYDNGSKGHMYLFHKEKNGVNWDYYSRTNIDIGQDEPNFMSGNDFVSIGSRKNGKLFNYVWNGNSWRSSSIDHGNGDFYYSANNNFVITLDTSTGTDILTYMSYVDKYYFHYLDSEKKWYSRSWSEEMFSKGVNGIGAQSRFYLNNSIAGFVADNNPEYFIRWSENYDLIHLDNVLGGYNDNFPLLPVGNNLFSLNHSFYGYSIKLAAFDGIDWKIGTLPNVGTYYGKLSFTKNMMTFQNHNSFNNGNSTAHMKYDPNTDNFSYFQVNDTGNFGGLKTNAANLEFILAGDKAYRKLYTGFFQQIGNLDYGNTFSYSDGLNHTFVEESSSQTNWPVTSYTFQKSTMLYINKESGEIGNLVKFNLGNRKYMNGNNGLGGYYNNFLSPKAMWLKHEIGSGFNPHLYRIIDDKVNQSIYDIVVSRLDLDDDNGNVRKIEYTYNNPKPSSDNSITYYGEVTVQNRGFGTGNIGKITKIFNTGETDIRLTGLPMQVNVVDKDNNLKSKTTNTWIVNTKNISNGSFQVGIKSQVLLSRKKEEMFFDLHTLESITNNYYNNKGQLNRTTTTNSKGQIEEQRIKYAHEQFPFIEDKNMISSPYETTAKINNKVVNVSQNVWVYDNNKVYMSQNWSGPTLSDLRLDNEVTHVDDYGNLLEISNGKNIFSSVLNGYNNNYEVATIQNAEHQEVLNELDVSYTSLQNLSTSALKVELLKLYSRLPESTINLSFYDENGRIINTVDGRQQEVFIYYDEFGRIDYITDGDNNVLEKKEYNFGTN